MFVSKTNTEMEFHKLIEDITATIYFYFFQWQPYWILRKQAKLGQAHIVCDGF